MTTERRPILFIMPTGDFRGGAERMLRNVAIGLHERGVPTCYVFLGDGPLLEELEDRGIDVRLVNAGRIREIGTYLSSLHKISHVIKTLRPVLIIDWMLKGRLYGGVVGMLRRIPTGVWLHDFDGDGILDKLAFMIPIQEAWASSEAIAMNSRWRAKINKVPSIVHPGVEIEVFRKSEKWRMELRRRLGIPENCLVLGAVARLVRWKGIDKAIQTLEYVPEAHLVIVGGDHFGDPEYPRELAQLVERLDLAQRVHFVGHQTNVEEWMNTFDIFLHLTTRANPADQVIKEAMACGVPVIASRSGYTEEVITHMVNGIVVDEVEPRQIAESISLLTLNTSLLHNIGQHACRTIAELFSVDAMIEDFLLSVGSTVGL